jgi:hypothetical protein
VGEAPVQRPLLLGLADEARTQPEAFAIPEPRAQLPHTPHRMLGVADLDHSAIEVEQIDESVIKTGEFFERREQIVGARDLSTA